MNEVANGAAVEQLAKVEPQNAEPKPVKVITPKVAKAPKAKPSKVKAAGTATKQAKAKKPTQSKGKARTKTAKPSKAKAAKLAKATMPNKFPRHPKNPYRPSAYGAIFDAFVTKKNGIRRDELLKLAMEATGKDVKHASYDLAVILSAKESPTGKRHQSAREGYFVEREGDCLTLKLG